MTIKVEAVEAAQAMARQQGLDISTGKMMLILGSFLEAGGYDVTSAPEVDPYVEHDPEHAERVRLFDGYSKLVSARARIAAVEAEVADLCREDGDWHYDKLYNHLFKRNDSATDEINVVLKGIGRHFPDYYDPDTTYKEDAEAYIRALDELIEGMRREISGEIAPEEPHWTAL